MSRNKKLGYVILLIAFVIVSVVAFALPTAKTTSFWVAYIFTCIAFVAQVFIWNIGFKDNTPLRSKFLGIPVIRVGYIYLVFQLKSAEILSVTLKKKYNQKYLTLERYRPISKLPLNENLILR